jgi:hypothetical protein
MSVRPSMEASTTYFRQCFARALPDAYVCTHTHTHNESRAEQSRVSDSAEDRQVTHITHAYYDRNENTQI